MIDISNVVYTRLKIAISKICENSGTTYLDSSPSFPFLSVIQEDNFVIDQDMENSENAVMSVIKLESYSSISMTEAKKIISFADDEMRRMGYVRKFGPKEITNVSDIKIKRVIARYQRIFCEGDSI